MHFWLAENKSIFIIIIIIIIIVIIIIYYYYYYYLLLSFIIIIYYYYYYYSIIMQHACKVVKQVQITNCTHTFKILFVSTRCDVFSCTWF